MAPFSRRALLASAAAGALGLARASGNAQGVPTGHRVHLPISTGGNAGGLRSPERAAPGKLIVSWSTGGSHLPSTDGRTYGDAQVAGTNLHVTDGPVQDTMEQAYVRTLSHYSDWQWLTSYRFNPGAVGIGVDECRASTDDAAALLQRMDRVEAVCREVGRQLPRWLLACTGGQPASVPRSAEYFCAIGPRAQYFQECYVYAGRLDEGVIEATWLIDRAVAGGGSTGARFTRSRRTITRCRDAPRRRPTTPTARRSTTATPLSPRPGPRCSATPRVAGRSWA